jgi:hypothetical protein
MTGVSGTAPLRCERDDWTQIDDGTSCGACSRESSDKAAIALTTLAHKLATCEHEVTRETEQATGHMAMWCPICGACRTFMDDGPWMPSELAREAKALVSP